MSHKKAFDVEGGDFEKYTSQLVAQSQSKQDVFSAQNQQKLKADLLKGMQELSSLEKTATRVQEQQDSLIDQLREEDGKIKEDLAQAPQQASPSPSFIKEEEAAPAPEADPAPEARPQKKEPREFTLQQCMPNASPAYQDRLTRQGRRKLAELDKKPQPIFIPIILMWVMTAAVGYFSLSEGEVIPVCAFAAFSLIVSCLLIRSKQKHKNQQQK